jgi:hypothetical protein
VGEVLDDEVQPVRLDQVALAERHHAAVHAEEAQHPDMLQRLGHRPLGRRDHQECGVDALHPGEHVAHEPLMPRHVHQPNPAAG